VSRGLGTGVKRAIALAVLGVLTLGGCASSPSDLFASAEFVSDAQRARLAALCATDLSYPLNAVAFWPEVGTIQFRQWGIDRSGQVNRVVIELPMPVEWTDELIESRTTRSVVQRELAGDAYRLLREVICKDRPALARRPLGETMDLMVVCDPALGAFRPEPLDLQGLSWTGVMDDDVRLYLEGNVLGAEEEVLRRATAEAVASDLALEALYTLDAAWTKLGSE